MTPKAAANWTAIPVVGGKRNAATANVVTTPTRRNSTSMRLKKPENSRFNSASNAGWSVFRCSGVGGVVLRCLGAFVLDAGALRDIRDKPLLQSRGSSPRL